MKMTVFTEAAPYNLMLMMEAQSSSEMSVNIYHTTSCYIPEDNNFHTLLNLIETAFAKGKRMDNSTK
jgi:hypothetical protein